MTGKQNQQTDIFTIFNLVDSSEEEKKQKEAEKKTKAEENTRD